MYMFVCEFQCVGGWISVPVSVLVISSGDTDQIKERIYTSENTTRLAVDSNITTDEEAEQHSIKQ